MAGNEESECHRCDEMLRRCEQLERQYHTMLRDHTNLHLRFDAVEESISGINQNIQPIVEFTEAWKGVVKFHRIVWGVGKTLISISFAGWLFYKLFRMLMTP